MTGKPFALCLICGVRLTISSPHPHVDSTRCSTCWTWFLSEVALIDAIAKLRRNDSTLRAIAGAR